MQNIKIPRIFHRIWHGDEPMPDEYVKYGNTWLKHHPNWEMKLWNEKNMIPLYNQKAYNNTNNKVLKADIARYEIIYNFGGVYIDCDFECLKNIEPLISSIEAFCGKEDNNYICTAILGGIPKHLAFKALVEGTYESIIKNQNRPINWQTGPIYATKILNYRKDITIFPPNIFYPYHYTEKYKKGQKFMNAYAVHHWAGSWLNKK